MATKDLVVRKNILNINPMPNYLGQYFLKNPGVVKKIIAAVEIEAGDTIVEIGPGRGALTRSLAEACVRAGVKLILIEKDEKLAEGLEKEFVGSDGVKLIRGDALAILKKDEIKDAPGIKFAAPFKIVGNIPYYITGHLFRVVSELAIKPVRCIFMIQEEVAERIVAQPPKMNRLAASVQFWADPKIIARVPKGDFSPVPKVDSAVIALATKHPQPSAQQAEHYYIAVHALFAQPRKTILNNLAAAPAIGVTDKDEITRRLSGLGITSGLRPQDLTIKNINDIVAEFC
jgi:16S rRNA (adenine1518-N6/adenine1519-N6)-dimethyltransferase